MLTPPNLFQTQFIDTGRLSMPSGPCGSLPPFASMPYGGPGGSSRGLASGPFVPEWTSPRVSMGSPQFPSSERQSFQPQFMPPGPCGPPGSWGPSGPCGPSGPYAPPFDPFASIPRGPPPRSCSTPPAPATQPLLRPPSTTQPPGGSLQSPAGPSHGSGLPLEKNVTVQIIKLLDMPVAEDVLGIAKQYRIRVLDEEDRELLKTGQIEGMAGDMSKDKTTETVHLAPRDGTLRLETQAPVIFLEIRYAGAFWGNRVVGRCKLHRHDPRSSQPWPYALNTKDGTPAGCGIELLVKEGLHGGAMATEPKIAHPAVAAPPRRSDDQSPGNGAVGLPAQLRGLPSLLDDIVATMQFDRVEDLPAHALATTEGGNEPRQQIVISLEDGDRPGVALAEAGPFNTETQSRGSVLRVANCQGRQALAMLKAPYFVGAEAGEGAFFIVAKVWYLCAGGRRDFVGQTDVVTVTWEPKKDVYHELRARHNSPPIGGVIMTYRLCKQSQVLEGTSVQNKEAPMRAQVPIHVSGRSGNFPPGSPEEACEHAILNYQAQNRANVQRLKGISDIRLGPHDETGACRVVNGFREWRDLDALFLSLGPSILVDDEATTNVTRAFQENSTLMDEVGPKLAAARGGLTTVDQAVVDRRIVAVMHEGDPDKVEAYLRPELCKDPKQIVETGDMRWCPDPPLYTSMKNMRDDDRETLRLARFRPEQDAKLWFHDVNTTYNVKDDVWGIVEDFKTAQSHYVPEVRERLVRDDCIMA